MLKFCGKVNYVCINFWLSNLRDHTPLDVEVAAIEAAEAERVYHAAAAVKRAINKIPKGKAGGGKGESY